jgi:RNA polymerase sigma-B factor
VNRTAEQASSETGTTTSRLLRAYHQHDDVGARDELVNLYLPLVEALAQRHDRRGTEHDDLVQAGSIGLLAAIQRFDLDRGSEFTAFAVPTIVGEMKRHLRDRSGLVRLPRRLQEAGSRLPVVRQQLTASLGRPPTIHELARGLELEPTELASLAAARRGGQSPDELPAGNPDPEDRLMLNGAFLVLDDVERKIVYLRYMRELSTDEVAKAVGLSERQLSRRTAAALEKLRGELEGSRAVRNPAPAPEPPARAQAPQHPPDARPADEHSGRLMLRMPHSLHGELARAAEREHVSLNQFITNSLSAAVSWRRPGEEGAPGAPTDVSEGPSKASSPRWLPAALVTNLVIVIVAGILAVLLLLLAWQQGF